MALFTRLLDRRTWFGTVYAMTSLVVGACAFTVGVTGASLAIGLLAVAVGVLVLIPTFAVCSWLAKLERGRVAVLLGVRIDEPPLRASSEGSWWARLGSRLWHGPSWKQLLYALLSLPVRAVAAVLVAAAWSAGLVLTFLPAYNWALPNGGARFGLLTVHGTLSTWPLALLGLILLVVVAPWVVAGVTAAQASLAVHLLGVSPTRVLEKRVGQLTESRDRSVDAAAAERRRIERDLHDGAQQRLVALAMDLGMAREKLASDPRPPGRWSRKPTRNRSEPWSSCGTWRAGSTPRYWSTAVWIRRSPPWPPHVPSRSGGRRPRHPPLGPDRGRRLLRRGRGAHQRGPARPCRPGVGEPVPAG